MSERFLPKQHIRRPIEFTHALKLGKRHTAGPFTCFYLKTDRDFSRLGMIIGKKYCKLAVARNRLKRLIREQFRRSAIVALGLDVVILLRASCEAVPEQEQKVCLEKLFTGFAA